MSDGNEVVITKKSFNWPLAAKLALGGTGAVVGTLVIYKVCDVVAEGMKRGYSVDASFGVDRDGLKFGIAAMPPNKGRKA